MSDKEKTIKEEMSEKNLVLTITLNDKGEMNYTINKTAPLKLLRGMVHDVWEMLFTQELEILFDQKYMKKLGLKKTGN